MPFGMFSFIVVVDRLIEYRKIRVELNPYAVKESTPQVANRVTSLLIVLSSKRKQTTKTGRPIISTPFTAAEILECIHELGYTARLRSEEIGEFGECVSISITSEEELECYLYLGFSGPYFEEFEISTYVYTKENPYLEANRWHANDHLSVVTVDCNTETGNPEYENGMFTLHQRMMWHMDGLELAEGTRTALAIWDEEYVELLGQIHPNVEAE